MPVTFSKQPLASLQLAQSIQLCDRCNAEITTKERPFDKKLMSSVYIPGDAEVSRLNSMMKDVQHDLNLVQSEINKVEKIRHRLTEQKRYLQKYLDHHTSVVSAFRRLPVEIVRQIFDLCSCRLLIQHPKPTMDCAPILVLSQICSLWRSVALSMPHLWSELVVNLSVCRFTSGLDALVQLYLDRSSSSLLKFQVYANASYPVFQFETGLSTQGWHILESLIHEGHRWRSVYFTLHTNILSGIERHVHDLSAHCQHPHLRKLAVEWEEEALVDTDGFFPVLKHSELPSLIYLKMQDYKPTFQIPIHQLRYLQLKQVRRLDDLMHLFQSCPRLREVDITLDHQCSGSSITQTAPIVCEYLNSLKLNIRWNCGPASALLDILVVPELDTFTIQSRLLEGVMPLERDRQDWLTSLGDFVRRSAGIQTLELKGNMFLSDQELVQILRLKPSLAHLTLDLMIGRLDYALLTTEFWQALSFDKIPGTADICLPKLLSLQLVISDDWYPSDNVSRNPLLPDPVDILASIQSRRTQGEFISVVQLQRFDLTVNIYTPGIGRKWTEKFFSEVRPRFRALEKDGLAFKLQIAAAKR
ncbi:hypothetical protein VKT23_011249 [Stygiomarasmius scandens]|uniref:F-box domain-containing protein n=1 Tax=Marasmiellus scandens TaxID=2682957 RepID=A0ABR1JEK1_9AGAR